MSWQPLPVITPSHNTKFIVAHPSPTLCETIPHSNIPAKKAMSENRLWRQSEVPSPIHETRTEIMLATPPHASTSVAAIASASVIPTATPISAVHRTGYSTAVPILRYPWCTRCRDYPFQKPADQEDNTECISFLDQCAHHPLP
jgi:hypothetical protein